VWRRGGLGERVGKGDGERGGENWGKGDKKGAWQNRTRGIGIVWPYSSALRVVSRQIFF